MTVAWLAAAAFFISAIGTGLARRYAVAQKVLDLPNDRSSHAAPTPRGGGVAIVLAFLGGVIALAAFGIVGGTTAVALGGAGLIVTVVGFLDDHRSVPTAARLLAHFAAAAWALAWLGGLPPIPFFGAPVDLGWLGDALAAVGLVWLLNLYNFMDGIDGIAGVEAVTVCVGAALLYAQRSDAGGETALVTLLAAATLGFLVWNWPPAKIFMGDAGSGFLGLTLGVLGVRAAGVAPAWFWSWAILLGAFIADATVTLIRRLVRRERVYEAHRSHAYQHAAARVGHGPVSAAVGAITIVWLLPWALLVGTGRMDGPLGAALAYAPVVGLAVWLGAAKEGGRARPATEVG